MQIALSLKALLVAALVVAANAVVAQTTSAMRAGDVAVGDGVRIHYVDGGDAKSSTTILFVPGWSMSSAVWRDQMLAFAATARVVSIDPRSQGQSTITTRSNTPEQRAQDLHQVIQSLALRNIVLVGWSQGVQDVAAYAAAFAGSAISRYVLVDAAVGAGAAESLAHPGALQQQLDRLVIYEQHPREYLQGMMTAIIRSREGREHIAEYVEIGLRTPPDLGISMLIMDFIAYDRRPALAKFNRPTLIIASAHADDIEAQRDMSKQIEDARFVVIEDAGHAVFLDQPKQFHDLVAEFVQ
jgi:pimeloyl-ACP methyl ester carboxylesterase